MIAMFREALAPGPEDKVLDLGVTPDSSLPESNLFEAIYPWRQRVTAASIEDAAHLERVYPGVRFARIDGSGRLPFRDDEFDVLFCSAVLEHVGPRSAQAGFVREALRVSKRFFFTTPNRWYPVEFHTFLPLAHWLPQPAHQGVLRALGYQFLSRTENLNLLDERALRSLFVGQRVELQVRRVRLFGVTSNLVAEGRKVG